jgi:2Fe-2S ferredoxin
MKVRFYPQNKVIEARENMSILQLARKLHISISTRCDGQAACMMCKVKIQDDSGLKPAAQKEIIKLGEEAIQKGFRLSCQAVCGRQGQVVVEIPESPLKAAIRAQLAKQQEEDSLW